MDRVHQYRESDVNKYFRILTKYADMGNEEAIKIINMEYNNDVKNQYMDELQTHFYLSRAYAQQNNEYCNSYSIHILGYMYNSGEGVIKDYNKSIELYNMAIKLGNGRSANNLGSMYNHGWGVIQDYSRAIELYNIAVNLNSSNAMINLAYIYENGKGVTQDYDKAIELYNMAVKLDRCNAMFKLANIYINGIGVKQDYNKAIELYNMAVNLGHSDSINNLARMYNNGEGITRDYNKAIELYNIAVNLGNSRSMCNLGLIYNTGEGVTRDYNKAIELYNMAINLGDNHAMYSLGLMYNNGEGVTQDYNKAIELYNMAINLGNSDAMFSLGYIYHTHVNIQDFTKAIELYNMTIKFKNIRAMYNLGHMYECDNDVHDHNKAIELYNMFCDNCQHLYSDPDFIKIKNELIQRIRTHIKKLSLIITNVIPFDMYINYPLYYKWCNLYNRLSDKKIDIIQYDMSCVFDEMYLSELKNSDIKKYIDNNPNDQNILRFAHIKFGYNNFNMLDPINEIQKYYHVYPKVDKQMIYYLLLLWRHSDVFCMIPIELLYMIMIS